MKDRARTNNAHKQNFSNFSSKFLVLSQGSSKGFKELTYFGRMSQFALFISNYGQALALKVTCIFKIFRAQSCLTIA